MLRIALISLLAALAISCNQPKISVSPVTATISAGDSLIYAVDAVRWDFITLEVNGQPAGEFYKSDPEKWPVTFTEDTPGEYSIYWTAHNNAGATKLASVYTYVTVTD